MNKYVSGEVACTNSRVRVASIISACHIHFEKTMEEMRPAAVGEKVGASGSDRENVKYGRRLPMR